ncbi:MAG: FAD-dependent oxidoreductase [Christensenellaceae bacterium]|nr:FAD-dependent oxidoreductase [Christensenellaceae bacterium]
MYDIIIAGAGPGGLSAAMYAARAGKNVVVIAESIGGTASCAHNIENFSGHISISGLELTQIMHKQCERLKVNFIISTMVKMELKGNIKLITLIDGRIISAHCVILAMGATCRTLGLKEEVVLMGHGLSYCAMCDGSFYKNCNVIVNGGGNTALDSALFLASLAKTVTLIHRNQSFRAAKILTDRLKDSGVKLVLDSVITNLKGAPLNFVEIKNVVSGVISEIQTDALFVAIGIIPNTGLVKSEILLDENSKILTDAFMRTNIENVYAIGDIRNTPLRQIMTACADGAIASEHASKQFKM